MLHLAIVAAGGAIGASLRHLVGMLSLRLAGREFPWGTLAVNLVGCLAMGLFIGIAARRLGLSNELRLFVATGILGGFTTFSAFSLDAVLLWERHEHLLTALYVGGSVALAIAGLVLGLWIMRTALA